MNDVVPSPSAGCGQPCACGRSNVVGDRIDRRDFVTRAAAAIAAAALAACGMGAEATSPNSVSATTLALADYPALSSVGGVATTSVDGVPLAIVRTGDTSFAAFSRICPHQGGRINVTTSGFQCPQHGATFDRSGQWIGGQHTTNMKQYPAAYDAADGTVTVG